jgi:lipopolysaccharide heptosyltransferase II
MDLSAERAAVWANARRILCVRLDNLGDLLMTTPALHAIKCRPGNPCITLLGSPTGIAAVPFIKDIDRSIAFDAPWVKRDAGAPPSAWTAVIGMLAAFRFDAAVIFTVYSQSALPAALLCGMAGIPLRIAHCRENPYELLTDWIPETEPHAQVRHEAKRQLDLVAAVGYSTADTRMRFEVPAAARSSVDALLSARGIAQEEAIIVLHPGATAPSRRYPAERYAEVARTLAEDCGHPVVVTGSTSERELTRRVCHGAAHRKVHDFAALLGLPELAALISRAALLVSNNSGPVHVASAVGTPVVDLYALTNPQHTPWQVSARVLSHDVQCKYCYKSVCPQGHNDCLRRIEPSQIVAAASDLLRLREDAEL